MKVLRGTLTFVLGMIVGIVLFIGAIAGTIFALATAITVGDLQAKFTDQKVVAEDSQLYKSTIWDAVTTAIGDFQNIDQISLEKLYQQYGLSVFNGVGGLDFTDKDFYTTPIKTIMGDFSVLVNSFTLRDVSKLTGNDFESYDLPILKDNLDNNVKTALDNILGSVKGDLTVRTIKTNLIPSFDVAGSALISALQDIRFDEFGSAINAFKLCTFLDVDTDSFIPSGPVFVYVKSDRYEQVSASDLSNANYEPKDGAELYNASAYDSDTTDTDTTPDTMLQKELRFVNKGTQEEPNYVVDNSCYSTDFNAAENTKTFYRHYEYEQYSAGKTYPAGTEYFVKVYGNRVTTFSGENFNLYFKGYASLKNVFKSDGTALNTLVSSPTIDIIALGGGYKDKDENFVAAEAHTIKDATIKKTSKLVKKDFVSARDTYFRIHAGTSEPLLQSFAYLSIAELQNMDDFVDNVTVGDVIKIDDSSSAILKSLKNSKFSEISSTIDNLTIGEVLTINYSHYVQAAAGEYVYMESADNYIKYNENLHAGMQRYARTGDAAPYTYTPDENGAYVKNGYFAKYDDLTDAQKALDPTRYSKQEVADESSLIMQALALREVKLNEMSTVTNKLFIYEIVDVAANDTSLLIKSLAKKQTKIEDLGTVTDSLEIGEVIEINDGSALIMKSLDKRHVAIKDLGGIADLLTIDEIIPIDEHSSRLLQSLKKRGCTINGIGTAVDSMTLAEIIDIYDNHQVELSTDPIDDDSKFLIYHDGETYANGREAIYVYDSNGKYIKSPIEFVEATAAEKGAATPNTYDWASASGLSTPEFMDYASSGNIYYKDGDVYKQKIQLCIYLFNTGVAANKVNLYYRVSGSGANAYDGYDGTDLYVKVLGKFVAYDPSNPAHSDMTIYKLHKSNDLDTYFVRLDEYRDIKVSNSGSEYTYDMGGSNIYEDGVSDRYALQYCDDVYVKDENGGFVFIDNAYVAYDEGEHEGLDRFKIEVAFLANKGQADHDASAVHVNVIHEKSAPVLRMMSAHNINDIGDVVASARLEQLMDITPDSMFDKTAIRESTINGLGDVMSVQMNTMSIGELLDWANITDINPNVRSIIADATLTNFFKSLTYDPYTGNIYLSMAVLYGIDIFAEP